MIERLIYQALRDGLDEVIARPGLLVEILQVQHDLDEAEALSVRDFLLQNPPDVRHGYARSDAKFPCMAIVLGDERTSMTFIGDEGGFVDDVLDEDFGADERAMIFTHSYSVLVYAQHPDLALYYYELAKFFLVGQMDAVKERGIFDINFSGSDMAPDDKFIPAGLFLRRFTMTCSKEYKRVVPATREGRAWEVAAIHVTTLGADGRDVGGVKTQVTIPLEDGDGEG